MEKNLIYLLIVCIYTIINMKILCLHGLRHNKDLLERSIKPMFNKFKDVTFVFINAPFTFPNEPEFYCWWNATRENAQTIEKYDTINESLQYITNIWNNDKFDGILGFSQGSVVAQIFCYHIQNNVINTHSPKFAIFCSTTEISDISLHSLYQTKLKIPICVMYGIKDTLVTNDVCIKVGNKLSDNPHLIEHCGGHYVASNRDVIVGLQQFFVNVKKIDI